MPTRVKRFIILSPFEILKKASIDNGIYTDIKPVREAFGIAYLAILEVIDEALIRMGLNYKELPKSVDSYRQLVMENF